MVFPHPASHHSSFSVCRALALPKSCPVLRWVSIPASPRGSHGKDALLHVAEKRLRAPAWPWQGPGMPDPDPDPASGEGIWIPRSSHGTWRRCQGRSHSCSSHLHPSFLQRKTHYGASMFLLWICALRAAFLGLCSAGALLTEHTWDHVLLPPHWEGGSCPSSPPLLTSEGTARHEVPQDDFPSSQQVPGSSCPSLWLCPS